MIRYSELMLGDYVLVSGTPRKVEMITKKKIGYHINPQENRLYYARLKDVEPIEITEEVLKDISFKDETYYLFEFNIDEHKKAWYYLDKKAVTIFWYGKDEGYTQGERCIRNLYVSTQGVANLHQLQHAFRMSGIEIDWTL